MATVFEVELEQKTSEYISFVKEYFVATGQVFYDSPTMRVVCDEDRVILEYEGN